MLVPFRQLVREGASDPPQAVEIGLNPEEIKLVRDEEQCFGWTGPACRLELNDGRELILAATAKDVILATRGLDAIVLAVGNYASATGGTPQ